MNTATDQIKNASNKFFSEVFMKLSDGEQAALLTATGGETGYGTGLSLRQSVETLKEVKGGQELLDLVETASRLRVQECYRENCDGRPRDEITAYALVSAGVISQAGYQEAQVAYADARLKADMAMIDFNFGLIAQGDYDGIADSLREEYGPHIVRDVAILDGIIPALARDLAVKRLQSILSSDVGRGPAAEVV